MKKAQNGVEAAIKAQKEKRAAIQAKSDAKKEEAMAPRRVKGLPTSPAPTKTKTTTLPAGSGSIKKYMNVGMPGKKSMTAPTKATSAPKSAPAKPKITRTASVAVTAPKREMPSGMSKPSAPGVSTASTERKYSESEAKQMAQAKKVKEGKGSVAGAQAKITATRTKERAANQKAGRVAKRTAIRAIRKGK